MEKCKNKSKTALSIYIHIPFCIKKCFYCDFLSYIETENMQEKYIKALLNEINSCSEEFSDYEVETIFFGGGTPSSINKDLLITVMETVKKSFFCSSNMEVTLEANPGTLTEEKLIEYKNCGINRLSIGLQSADNEELKILGRIHTFEQFEENYKTARKAGFDNINIDLISALPYQTVNKFDTTLRKVIALKPEHISVYSLIIEEGTLFYDKYENDKSVFPSEEIDRKIYRESKKILEENGYTRYEISNYAKKGYESRHNMAYWKRADYLGLGLGSSSFINGVRYSNEENMKDYIENSRYKEKIRKNIEILTKKSAMEEFAFLGLRLMEGIKKKEFYQEFGESISYIYGDIIKKYLNMKMLKESEDSIAFTDEGIDVSNVILADFIQD